MTIVRVKSVVTNPVEKTEGAPMIFLGLEDLESRTGRILTEELPMKRAEDAVSHRKGDVLFSKLRPYLAKSYLPIAAGSATGELLVLRPGPRVDARFLFYATLSTPWIEWANNTAYGTKMPRTSWELVGEYRMKLPQLEEQRRISDFLDVQLSRLDRIRSARQKQLNALDQRRTALMSACVTHAGRDAILHPLLGAIKRDWTVAPLRRVVAAINVGVVINPSTYFTSEGAPFIHGFNVREGWISNIGMKFMTPKSNLALQRSQVRQGDVLVVRAGATSGRAAMVPVEYDGANCASVLILRRGSIALPKYIETFFNSNVGKGQVQISQYGAAQEVISAGQVSSFLMAVPSLAEQRHKLEEYEANVRVLADARSNLKKQIDLLTERRQALITAAVTGQIDVSTASGRGVAEGVTR